jgi:hypothetical protein
VANNAARSAAPSPTFERITHCTILLDLQAASPEYGEEVNEGPDVKRKNNGQEENKDDRAMRKTRISSRRKMMKRKRGILKM